MCSRRSWRVELVEWFLRDWRSHLGDLIIVSCESSERRRPEVRMRQVPVTKRANWWQVRRGGGIEEVMCTEIGGGYYRKCWNWYIMVLTRWWTPRRCLGQASGTSGIPFLWGRLRIAHVARSYLQAAGISERGGSKMLPQGSSATKITWC